MRGGGAEDPFRLTRMEQISDKSPGERAHPPTSYAATQKGSPCPKSSVMQKRCGAPAEIAVDGGGPCPRVDVGPDLHVAVGRGPRQGNGLMGRMGR